MLISHGNLYGEDTEKIKRERESVKLKIYTLFETLHEKRNF